MQNVYMKWSIIHYNKTYISKSVCSIFTATFRFKYFKEYFLFFSFWISLENISQFKHYMVNLNSIKLSNNHSMSETELCAILLYHLKLCMGNSSISPFLFQMQGIFACHTCLLHIYIAVNYQTNQPKIKLVRKIWIINQLFGR